MKPVLPDVIFEQIRQGHHRHADMVSHAGVDQRKAFALGRARVVERVHEAVIAEGPHRLEAAKIVERTLRIDQRGEGCSVGCDDQVAFEAALQCQVGDAKGPILVREVQVAHVVRAFAHAPRHIVTATVGVMTFDHAVIGLIEDRERQ